MANPNQEKALVLAIELLTKQVADLPVAMAMNAGKTVEEILGREHLKSRSALDPLGFGRDEGAGGSRQQSGNSDVAGKNPFWSRHWEGFNRRLGSVTETAGMLGASFGRLLGPLSTFGGYLTTSTAGFQTFTAAMSLWQASVGMVVAPVLFTFSTGLVAASDVLAKKLAPHMDAFAQAVLSTGIPAVTQFAETVGHATDALRWIADSKLGGAVLPGGEGGTFGAFNRSLGRLGAVDQSGPARADDSLTAYLKAGHRAADDLLRLMPGGDAAAGSADFLRRNLFGVEAYSGKGVATGAESSAAADTERAKMDTLREMQLQFGARGGATDLRGSFRSYQTAALNMTPFQQRTLALMQEMLSSLTGAAGPTGAPAAGVYTPADMRDEFLARARAAGFRIGEE